MPLDLENVQSGYNLAVINENFQRIEDTWDEKLDRVNSGSFYNQMEQALDMNSNEIINTRVSDNPTSLVTKEYVDALFGAIDGAEGIVPLVEVRQQGDGVTTTFNSPATGPAPNNSFFVNIDGVTQRPITDYVADASGNIEFTVAPPINSDIDITYFSPASLAGNVTVEQIPTYTDLVFDSVADAIAINNPLGLKLSNYIGKYITVNDYYGGVSPSNSGAMTFRIVTPGTGTEDGGKYINGLEGNFQLEQLFNDDVPTLKQYGGRDEGALGFDNAAAFQNCIDYNSSMTIDQSNIGYLIGTSINLTNRQSGVSIQCPGHVGINNLGCYLMGNTGEFPVLDTTGSQRNFFHNFGIKTATGNTNPSKLGCLFARSDVVAFAQFNILDNFVVRMDTDDSAFGGKGTVGIMNIASEIFTFRDVYAIANTGCYIGSSNFFNVSSQYATLNTAISSTSTFMFEGTTVFDSNGSVGTPLHCSGAQAGKSSSVIYLNGRGGTPGDIGAGGVRFDGGCTNWDATFFLEFTTHVGYFENGFRDNKIKFLGQVTADRYMLTNAGFTGVNNCEFTFARTVSGAFTAPDYFIAGDLTDVYKNVSVKLDYDPAVDFIVPTNLQSNRVLCDFSGETIRTSDTTAFSTNVINIVRTDTRTGAGIYYIAGTSPEGVLSANIGSLCLSNIGATGRIWRKVSGTGNTGWSELT